MSNFIDLERWPHYYRPQIAKVMFLQVSVCPQGGMRGRGWCAWLGGMCGREACMVGACVAAGQGHAWQGGMHGRGHAWQGGFVARGCVVGGMCGQGVCVAGGHTWWGACMAGGCV